MYPLRLRALAMAASLAAACSGSPGRAPAAGSDRTGDMLGRWDVTATADGEMYPLWFELTEQSGKLGGRFQGRFGHAVPMDSAEASGNQLTFRVSKDTYTGTLTEGRWEGSAQIEDGTTLEWTALRAPELARPANPVWGEPITLFNGEDSTGWLPRHPGEPNQWKAERGALVNQDKGSDLVSEAKFEDFKLHIEVNVPPGGNSGIYLRGRYEVQVQDDYGKEPGSRYMGGIYGQVTPTTNAARRASEWQEYGITLLGRWVSVALNGTTVIDQQEIPGITGGALDSDEEEPGPLMLQGDHGPVSYRNIILTPVRKGSPTQGPH